MKMSNSPQKHKYDVGKNVKNISGYWIPTKSR